MTPLILLSDTEYYVGFSDVYLLNKPFKCTRPLNKSYNNQGNTSKHRKVPPQTGYCLAYYKACNNLIYYQCKNPVSGIFFNIYYKVFVKANLYDFF